MSASFKLPLAAALAVVLALGAYALLRPRSTDHAEHAPGKAVPVVVAVARIKPLAAAFDAIATVQAINTVTIHSRVDGLIERVLFKEGAQVRRGQVLAVLDRRPFEAQLSAANAQRQKDLAVSKNLQRDLERYEFLVKADSAPAQTLDATRAQLAQARAALAGDAAQIQQARLQLGYATITSPIDGRTGARLIDAGNLIHAADAGGLVMIAQIDPAVVSFAIPQSLLPKLRRQMQSGQLRVEARDAAGTTTLATGAVTFVDSQVDATTATVRCKATFANPKEALWPGTFVTAHLILGATTGEPVVPSRAIQSGDHPFVYVVTADHKAIARPILVLATDGQDAAVSGVNAGEQVVVEGQFRLEDGASVSIQAEAAPPAAPVSDRKAP